MFNRQGARQFGQLTREHLPEEGDAFKYQLAILLDNLVMSAPSINSEIRDQGIIEGGGQGFKPKEVEHLIKILQAGSLPASLNPTPLQEEKVGPTLGEDTIAKGWLRHLGLDARRADLHGHLLPVRGRRGRRRAGGQHDPADRPMAFMQATFSLPGLAGLALTIGMAVDANVLVFERMREEKERGASLAQQIRNGFNRAWVTIFDSHVTNFLAAIVLYAVGHRGSQGLRPDHDHRHALEPVHRRLRLAGDLRVLVSAGLAQAADDVKMMDKTNIDFIGPRYYCMAGSLILILLGLVAFFARGRTMYNIDFTGGTLVTIRLNEADPTVKSLTESQRAEFVRQKASVLPDVTVESLRVGKDNKLTPVQHPHDRRQEQPEKDKVKDKILEAFGPALAKVEMTVGEAKPIPAAAAPAMRQDEPRAHHAIRRRPGVSSELQHHGVQ